MKTENTILRRMNDIWDNLAAVDLPIVLYGMGNGADKIIKVLEDKNIKFSGVFSSNGFQKENKIFHGFPVLSLSDIEKQFSDMIILMCFGSSRDEVIENVKNIKRKYTLLAPDVPVYGNTLFDKNFYLKNKEKHDYIYNLLADDTSKITFENTIKYKLTGDIDYLFDSEVDENEPYDTFFKLNDNETYLDLGAYRGETVFSFLKNVKNYNKIYAVEPDFKTFNKLKSATSSIKNINLINAAVSSKDVQGLFSMNGSRGSNSSEGEVLIDNITVDGIKDKITYIKVDVEGSEADFIKGAENTIRTYKPKMMISCYHRSEDLIDIPQKVLSIRNDYKIYMRHFRSIPAWDTAFYFI